MKWIKTILLLLLGLVAVNILSWAVIGQGQMLALAAEDFDGWGALTGKDTLHLYAHYPKDSADHWRDPGAFSPGARSRLMVAFAEEGTASAVQYHDRRLETLPDSLPLHHFVLGAGVRSRAPLHARVVAVVYAPGFVSDRTRDWLWIFGWWPLGRGTYGVS